MGIGRPGPSSFLNCLSNRLSDRLSNRLSHSGCYLRSKAESFGVTVLIAASWRVRQRPPVSTSRRSSRTVPGAGRIKGNGEMFEFSAVTKLLPSMSIMNLMRLEYRSGFTVPEHVMWNDEMLGLSWVFLVFCRRDLETFCSLNKL